MKEREQIIWFGTESESELAPLYQEPEEEDVARRFHTLSILLFCLYLCLLVWLVALKCNQKITITDTYYIFNRMSWSDKLQFAKNSCLSLFQTSTWSATFNSPRQDLLNTVAFLPFGIYLGYFIKKPKFPKVIIVSFLLSFFFEAMQLITHIGCFSAMDLVANTLGGMLGYLTYKLVYRDTPERMKVLTVATYIVLCAVVPLVCYAFFKTATMSDFYFDILSRRY